MSVIDGLIMKILAPNNKSPYLHIGGIIRVLKIRLKKIALKMFKIKNHEMCPIKISSKKCKAFLQRCLDEFSNG